VKVRNSCAGTLIFGSFFFIDFCQSFFPVFSLFSAPFRFFLFSVLLSFLLLSNWFLFLSSFVFPLLFRYCFIPVYLTYVVSSLAYLNLLGTKRLGCCCWNLPLFPLYTHYLKGLHLAIFIANKTLRRHFICSRIISKLGSCFLMPIVNTENSWPLQTKGEIIK
jgi:hypothetical protein